MEKCEHVLYEVHLLHVAALLVQDLGIGVVVGAEGHRAKFLQWPVDQV